MNEGTVGTIDRSDLGSLVRKIEESASHKKAAATQRVTEWTAGDNVRQGDVYMVCIEKMPEGLGKWTFAANEPVDAAKNIYTRAKLTQEVALSGQHVLNGKFQLGYTNKSVRIPGIKDEIPQELVGPVAHCLTECELDHPEHGNFIFPAGSTIQVIYQRTHDKDESIVRRTQD